MQEEPEPNEQTRAGTRRGFIDATDARERLTRGFVVVAIDAANRVELPDPDDIIDYFVSLETSETDRAIPTLAFSFLDKMFRGGMLSHLDTSHASEKFLTGPNGPLASASSRLALAAALGWISPGVAADLDHLRKIRNLFAHDPSITLDDSRVTGHLADHSQRELIEAMMGENPPDEIYMDRVGRHILGSPAFDPRLRLVVGAYSTTHSALTEIHLRPILQQHGVPLQILLSDSDGAFSPDLTAWFESPRSGVERIMDGSSNRLTNVRGGPAVDSTMGEIPEEFKGKAHAFHTRDGEIVSRSWLGAQEAGGEPAGAPDGKAGC